MGGAARRRRCDRTLAEYRRKRDFSRTPEPGGRKRKRAGAPRFVVQKHAARRLHYDFRLEMDGVMKSWAVTKGPSLDPQARRLAVHVEDHPIDYADFEGVIPSGEYGGGTVMVWDRGTWEPIGDPARGYREGKLSFRLRGHRLKGEWALVRMHGRDDGRRQNWLLIKKADEHADLGDGDVLLRTATKSVVSRRTMERIAAAADRVWHSNKREPSSKSQRAVPLRTSPQRRVTRKRTRMVKEVAREAPGKGGGRAKKSGRTSADVIESVRLTHPDRVLYPDIGLTKRGLAEYYVAVADWILPEVVHRPLSLVRCPDGLGKGCFYQKHLGAGPPEDLHCARIKEKAGTTCYAMIKDLKGLISLVQMSVLEIHPWGARIDRLEQPDRMVFDLDPDPAVPWADVVAAALETRQRLESLGLASLVKTTGGKGLHVVVPLSRRHDWERVHGFARQFADAMAADSPARYTARMAKAVRKGKIFIDYVRNARGATAVAAYSARARSGAPVATPLAWDELRPGLAPDRFTAESLPRRLAGLAADPWGDIRRLRQSLPKSG
jgi:bifunctional non-homologous end joining protein LigD